MKTCEKDTTSVASKLRPRWRGRLKLTLRYAARILPIRLSVVTFSRVAATVSIRMKAFPYVLIFASLAIGQLPAASPVSVGEGAWTIKQAPSQVLIDTLDNALETLASTSKAVSQARQVFFSDNGSLRLAEPLTQVFGRTEAPRFPHFNGDDNWVLRATGLIHVPEKAVITFGFISDDGGGLWINGEAVALFPEPRAAGVSLGAITLDSGLHEVTFVMWEQRFQALASVFVAAELGDHRHVEDPFTVAYEPLTVVDLATLTTQDVDADGLDDAWERHFFETLASSGDDDHDGDGLTNREERVNRSQPDATDSDGDGLSDGVEVHLYDSDPANADTDGDGLTDFAEVTNWGTSPSERDTDGDGHDDGAEQALGSDPNNAQETPKPVRLVQTSAFLENWTTGQNWEDGVAPVKDRDYAVLSRLELNSPWAREVTFEGRSLSLQNDSLLMLWGRHHTEIDRLTLKDARLQWQEQGALRGTHHDLSGTVTVNLFQWDQTPVLWQAPLTRSGKVWLLGPETTFGDDRPFTERAMSLEVDGIGSAYAGEWIIERNARVRFARPGAFARRLTVREAGMIDFGYNVSAPDTELVLESDEFHLQLDHSILLGNLSIPVTKFTLRPGSYSVSELINEVGFAPEAVAGEGRLIIVGEETDRDADGLPDDWEESFFGDLTSGRDEDGDADGLANHLEFAYATHPQLADSDQDGLDDREEVLTHLTNPKTADSDQDGLSDGLEVNLIGSKPLVADTDLDGLIDGEEVITYHTDPLSSDSDRDGFSDGEEIAATTNPDAAASLPRLEVISQCAFEAAPLGQAFPFPGNENEHGWSATTETGRWYLADRLTDPLSGDEFTLVSRELVLEDGWGRWTSQPFSLGGVRFPAVSIDIGVYEPSHGLYHSSDSLYVVLEASRNHGRTFEEIGRLIEGAGPPLEGMLEEQRFGFLHDAIAIDAALSAPLKRFRSPFKLLPKEATHVRVVINGRHEPGQRKRYRFDNVQLLGMPLWSASDDTDGDDITDLVEAQFFLDPSDATDASADFDDDGLTNWEEVEGRTNPYLADTDGDQLEDGLERTVGTNPLLSDSDLDGIDDGDEVTRYLTNPLLTDSDGGGDSDGLEVMQGTDPNLAGDDRVGEKLLGVINFEDIEPGTRRQRGTGLAMSWKLLGGSDSGVDVDFTDPRGNHRFLAVADRRIFWESVWLPIERLVDTHVSFSMAADVANFDRVFTRHDEVTIEIHANNEPLDHLGGYSDSGTILFSKTLDQEALQQLFISLNTDERQWVTIEAGGVDLVGDLEHSPQGVSIVLTISSSNVTTFFFDDFQIRSIPFSRGVDSDRDGLPDDYELANGLNPNLFSDANAVPDRDGRSHLEEFARISASILPASIIKTTFGKFGFAINFLKTPPAQSYEVDRSFDLLHWQSLGSLDDGIFRDPESLTTRQAYYRLRVVRP